MDSFEQIVAKYENMILKISRAFTSNEQDLEDLSQEILVQI